MFEEQLVEHAADVVGCMMVGASHVLGDVQCLADQLLLVSQVLFQGLDTMVGSG